VYRDDDIDLRWRADDEAPPPYVEPLSRYTQERRSVDVDRIMSRQHQRSLFRFVNLTSSVSAIMWVIICVEMAGNFNTVSEMPVN